MNRSSLRVLRTLLARHAFLIGLLALSAPLSGVACGGSDPVATTTPEEDAGTGDGGTTKTDGGTTADGGGTTDTGTGNDTGTGTESGSDATVDDAATDAAADGATDDGAADAALPDGGTLPTLSVDNVAIDEGAAGNASLTFTVTLSAASTDTITVAYATADGTATVADGDYTATTSTLTFDPGDTTKSVTVLVTGDTKNEADETLSLQLSAPTNAVIATGTGTGTITNDDALPTVSIGDALVVEGNSGTTRTNFTATLSAASGQTVTVHYATADGTATAGGDYTALPDTTLTFAPGETSKVVSVDVGGDVDVETNETFTVTLTSPANATLGTATGTGTIQNDDGVVLPNVTIGDVSITEGNAGSKVMTFTVTLSATPTQTITVDYKTTDGTASSASDFGATNGTVTFLSGDPTTKTISVNVNGDSEDESDETFTVDLSNATNALIADAQAVGTITNDDSAPSVSIAAAQVTEGQAGTANLTFNVTLGAASGKTVTVNYATADGTALVGGSAATGGQDYVAANGTLTFTPGTLTQTITVPVNGDVLDEADETLTATLSGPTNATLGTASATGTINDDDDSPTLTIDDVQVDEGNVGNVAFTFTATLSAPSARTVTTNFATANGTATAGSDYTANNGTLTFLAGETSKNITVQVAGDTTAEGAETFDVNLTGATNTSNATATGTGTIQNDDGALPLLSINDVTVTEGNAGTKTATFTVTLSQASAQAVTVNYATANGTNRLGFSPAISGGVLANGGQDYVATSGSLTFVPGDVSETITVTINGDVADEPNENYRVLLSSPSSNAGIGDGTGVGFITDNDATPTLSINDPAAVAEGNSGTKTITFDVTLSAVSGRTVTVGYATTNGTATTTGLPSQGGTDYVAKSGTLTFTPGQISKTVTVTVNGDTTDELGNANGEETFFVLLSNASGANISGANGSGTGRITDDDATPTLSINGVSALEGTPAPNTPNTTPFTFTVVLSGTSQSTVTVNYATANGTAVQPSDYVAQAGTLTFLPGDLSKTIIIQVNKDATTEPNQAFTVNLSAPTNATLLVGGSSGTGTIQNDD